MAQRVHVLFIGSKYLFSAHSKAITMRSNEIKRFTVLAEEVYTSAIGDPGMRRDGLRVAIEAWNQCNEIALMLITPLYLVPKSPNFKVRFTLDVKQGKSPRSQLYLMDIGSCWKNNGQPCNGDVTTDVTRYSEMIINPDLQSYCNSSHLVDCPPYHTFRNGTRIHRTDKDNYPYEAYHVYCSPGNAEYTEEPKRFCDPYSNPQPQEIVQIVPHPVWGEYGYPTKKGDGWIGDPRTWELNVGKLSQALYFYQDPGTKPVKRHWPSINLGAEVYIDGNEILEWTVSDFDIIITRDDT
ncbi:uncharacterized protein LOC131328706 [Rhododendron vialii]|uniref:uncharacterized protein LOC131328706 n=1 Tax=Rhododendron vialii TaxID=182163 RepID=UPI00265FAF31|nr:uncharacterized protein LOC131328706 [Rhododendron vialii]